MLESQRFANLAFKHGLKLHTNDMIQQ